MMGLGRERGIERFDRLRSQLMLLGLGAGSVGTRGGWEIGKAETMGRMG